MGVTKICIEGLNDTEIDLIEIKLRELIQQMKKCSELEVVKIWKEGIEDAESV